MAANSSGRLDPPARRGNNGNGGNTSRNVHGNADRLMVLFLVFVAAMGVHHLGLLRDYHNVIDGSIQVVRDEPGRPSSNFQRKTLSRKDTLAAKQDGMADPASSDDEEDTSTASPTTPEDDSSEDKPEENLADESREKTANEPEDKLRSIPENKSEDKSEGKGGGNEDKDVESISDEKKAGEGKGEGSEDKDSENKSGEKEREDSENKSQEDAEKKEEGYVSTSSYLDSILGKLPTKGVVDCAKSSETEHTKEKRLNVALFYADDWTMKVLGKFDKRVKTPNIDAMADKGMIFTNNCVTTSVCWASRSTLATGAYSAIHKHLMPFNKAHFETMVWPHTMYPLMKGTCKNGYYSGLFGKWHKLEVENELQAAFDDWRVYYGEHWEERDGKMQHVTELNKIDSLQFLDKWKERVQSSEKKQPFFLTTSFFATHARDGQIPSYQPQNNTRLNVYPDHLDIPTPKTATEEHFNRLPKFLKEGGNEGRTRWRNRFEPLHFQSNIKDMYAMATEVDEAVGAIIDKIKSLGVYDETVLIFTTDNGNMHGEHGLAEKWYPFEESLRVPLVIQDPRMPKERRGTMSDAWTLNVDLAPTILGISGIPPSEFMQGRDISDLYLSDQASLSNEELKEKVEWRKDWFYEFNLGIQNTAEDHPWKNYIDASFALVTDEWKYVHWPQHNYEQLFHRSVDPFDEWDLLNKVLQPNMTETQLRRGKSEKNGCCDTIQTTIEMYTKMKKRYAIMKERAQRGERI